MAAVLLSSAATQGFFVAGLFGSRTPSTDPLAWSESSSEISDKAGLVALSEELNPIIGYWDPLEIGTSDRERIAWYRHAEIKHGRVAMAGFVGFLVQSSGLTFPGNMIGNVPFAEIAAAGGPADQWDALPTAAKCQILLLVGALELWGESASAFETDGTVHYVRGGKPGYYPSFKKLPLPLNLFDPFNLQGKMTPQRKEKARLAEINNGRLAMLGIIGALSASKGLIVPGLDSLGLKPYAGEIMAPFAASDGGLPLVKGMLDFHPLFYLY